MAECDPPNKRRKFIAIAFYSHPYPGIPTSHQTDTPACCISGSRKETLFVGFPTGYCPVVLWKTKKKPSSPPGNCCKMSTCISACSYWTKTRNPNRPTTIQRLDSAGLVKAPETEFKAFKSFSCNTLPHNHLTGDYEWKEVKPKENSYETDRRLLQLDFHKWHKYIERNSHQLWQEHLIINSKYNMDDSRYMEPLLCCYPNARNR